MSASIAVIICLTAHFCHRLCCGCLCCCGCLRVCGCLCICCGLCCGMPYGLMYDDERILSTANRNFIGRQGTKKTLSYLCSPAVAAATALAGVVSDPRTL